MSKNVGARRLTVRTMAVGPGELEVQVADSGTGIPAEDLDRIFVPFVTSKEDGMGLGLAVCTMLIQAHGGRLWATNNNTGGATLHCRLPCHADDSDPQLASPGCSPRRSSP
jgi:signal transduction histidine kinase